MQIGSVIQDRLVHALYACGIRDSEFPHLIELPTDLANGDYTSSVALQYAKQAGMNPRSLAEKLVAELGSIEGVEKVDIAGPGFINFHLAPSVFASALREARTSERWGANDSKKGKRVMVEYTDPNPFKEFHIGHLMSNAIGESIARLFEYTGAEVFRANYQGDVGPHVAKAIWSMQKLAYDPHHPIRLGEAYSAGAKAYEESPEAKQEIDAINAKVYDRSDAIINTLYDAGRKQSLEEFEKIYALLGTTFDRYFFESETAPRGVRLVKAHPEVFEHSDGALVYKGEKKGLHTRVFLTSRGLPTYEAKDLGLAELKAEVWPFDLSITVTAHEQAAYFAVMLAALSDILPDAAMKIQHVSHGMMRLPSGKMSSRTGDVVTGESLLRSLSEAALERAKESRLPARRAQAGAHDAGTLANDIAVAAVKYQILKQASGRDMVFEEARALSLEGDSGPYIQYAHARACQVLERARAEGVEPAIDEKAESTVLARTLYRFPEIVARAQAGLEPHVVANYLVELAGLFNSWYAQVHILDGTPEAAYKVAVTDAVRATLKNGLWLLGIPAPEKM
jgi:arginyl-tRNA synthetase